MTSDDQFDKLIASTDECLFVAPIYVQPPDAGLALVKSEIQTLSADTSVQGSMEILNIVVIVCD